MAPKIDNSSARGTKRQSTESGREHKREPLTSHSPPQLVVALRDSITTYDGKAALALQTGCGNASNESGNLSNECRSLLNERRNLSIRYIAKPMILHASLGSSRVQAGVCFTKVNHCDITGYGGASTLQGVGSCQNDSDSKSRAAGWKPAAGDRELQVFDPELRIVNSKLRIFEIHALPRRSEASRQRSKALNGWREASNRRFEAPNRLLEAAIFKNRCFKSSIRSFKWPARGSRSTAPNHQPTPLNHQKRPSTSSERRKAASDTGGLSGPWRPLPWPPRRFGQRWPSRLYQRAGQRKEEKMARFPNREAEVAALAGTMVHGMNEHPEDFPDSPVTVDSLQEALGRFKSAAENAASAQGAVTEAFDAKQDAAQDLADKMKNVLRYAEIVHRDDEGKLKNIGWSGRSDPVKLHPPGVPRTLEVKREGRGWVYLDWKSPAEGGTVSAYRVLGRTAGETEWREVVLCFESMTVLTDQPQGVDLEYHVIAINKAGESMPSNLITVAI